jgi:hypothetical protein
MVPSIEEQISLLEFTPVEIERLAMAEHRRWVDERRMLGWKFAPVRDHAQKLSPYLVAWDQLTEEVKEVDRVLVRRIPANLAKADYQVRRIRGVGAKNPSDASADAIQLNPEFTEDEPSKERQEHQ